MPSMQPQSRRGVGSALLAALLFGASTPLAKGLGTLWLWRRRAGRAGEAALIRADMPWLLGAIGFGGFLGPLLLLVGLSHTPASAASLFLNLEGVLTAILAWVVFRENVDRRIALGMAAIGLLLARELPSLPLIGEALVLGAPSSARSSQSCSGGSPSP